MTKTELVIALKQELYNADHNSDPTLVNFWDDEIYWDRIAEVAVNYITESFGDVPWEPR